MSEYSDRLRQERRDELAKRAIPVELLNEYGETFAAMKMEAGKSFPAAAYAYVPNPGLPFTWKLRLWATPDGGPDARIVGAAIAALGKGFRGNKVQIPEADLPAVKAKVKAAWKKANPDKDEADMPSFSVEESFLADTPEELASKKNSFDESKHKRGEGGRFAKIVKTLKAVVEKVNKNEADREEHRKLEKELGDVILEQAAVDKTLKGFQDELLAQDTWAKSVGAKGPPYSAQDALQTDKLMARRKQINAEAPALLAKRDELHARWKELDARWTAVQKKMFS